MRAGSFLAAGFSLALALPVAAETATAPPLELSEEALEYVAPLGLYRAPGPERAVIADLPVIGPETRLAGAEVLRRLVAQGRAGGLAGVVYDNRDRGHSRLDAALFPQLTPARYDAELRERQLDYGLAGPILFRAPVIGNSSTALTSGPAPRSLGRLAMTAAPGPLRAWQLYAANHLYVYPGHRDHGRVDLFPANWPFMVLSQGSSYTDRPFVEALLLTLASFPPQTRARLEAEGLIAPTLQMILRRTLADVNSRAAYLSGLAHPTVFERDMLRPGRMAGLAAAMIPGEIPPLVVLRIEVDGFRPRGGLADLSERLFDTPASIARIWRGFETEKEMIVSAASTRDPNGRKLDFDWVLLRGDPERVRITPLDPRGDRARITLGWHDRRPTGSRDERLTDRVDIGVFAYNGVHDSAPAFISVSFPTHEQREFGTGPDGAPRLVAIDYDAIGHNRAFDPILHWSAPWRDVFIHDEQGRISGWIRHFAEGANERFERVVTGSHHRLERTRSSPPVLHTHEGE